jgi:hypothetical protein
VYNIFFDYFQVKGNFLNNGKSILDTCSNFLHNYSVRAKKPQGLKTLTEKLYPFAFFLRNKFNLATFDETRCFFAKLARNDLYFLPNSPEVISCEIHEVLSAALAEVSKDISKQIIDMVDKLPLLVEQIGPTKVNGVTTPMIQSISNTIREIVRINDSFMGKDNYLDQAMDNLLLVDIEAISSSERITTLKMKQNVTVYQNFRSQVRK